MLTIPKVTPVFEGLLRNTQRADFVMQVAIHIPIATTFKCYIGKVRGNLYLEII